MNIISRVWHLTNCIGDHKVQVCDSNISQEEAAAFYIQEGLLKGEAVIVFAKLALRKAIASKIDLLGLDVPAIRSTGQIKFFDAELLLASMQIDGALEEQAFQEHMMTVLQMSQSLFGKARVFCGMIDAMWEEKQSSAAMRLESLWAGMAQIKEFSLLCSYALDDLDAAVFEESLERICECHRHLIPCDSSESATGETAHAAFEAACNRVMEKLTTAPTLPSEITPTTLLN